MTVSWVHTNICSLALGKTNKVKQMGGKGNSVWGVLLGNDISCPEALPPRPQLLNFRGPRHPEGETKQKEVQASKPSQEVQPQCLMLRLTEQAPPEAAEHGPVSK